MRKLATIALLLALPPLMTLPTTATASGLSAKDQARVERAPRRDRGAVAECLRKKKKGGKTGAIAGAAGGAGIGLLAGGNLGETALAAGGGALAGHLIGKGTAT